MKILSATQIADLDSYTMKNEPIESIDLMERAALRCTEWLAEHFDLPWRFVILCGPGNNGGDGLAISRQLAARGREVITYALPDKGSTDNRVNYTRLKQQNITHIPLDSFMAENLQPHDVVVDALFGYGLTRPLEGMYGAIVQDIGQSDVITVAIDMPSGLFADRPSRGPSMKCEFTLTFQSPKLAFFMPENQDAVGEWIVLDIGLDQEKLGSLDTSYTTIESAEVESSLPSRHKFDHKGTYGHAFLIAGSFGKMGAAILAAKAALRSGVGLLTVHVPRQATTLMHVALPEAMISSDRHDYNFSGIDNWPKVTATGIGCGLGLHGCTTTGIRELLKNIKTPLVIDADGLNTISEHPELIDLLPEGTILTPHLKEFARLFGHSQNHFERILLASNKALEHKLVIVLKGAHTAIAGPDGTIHFNTTGNPGMATAGSGDVLTGIITGLLAQGMGPLQAAIAGVHLHGLAGDIAADVIGGQSLIASDIVDNLGRAFKTIRDL